MKVIVLASAKGGTGKSTLSAHLGVAAEMAGQGPAVLLDLDPQGSLSAWWNSREADTPALAPSTLAELPEKLAALGAAGYAVALVDTPPSQTPAIKAVIALADLVLIPVKPSPHDLRSVGATVELAVDAGRPFAFILSQAKSNALLTTQAATALSEHGRVASVVVGDRVEYASAMTDGRTVLETNPRGSSAAEMRDLWKFVRSRLDEGLKDRKKERKKDR